MERTPRSDEEQPLDAGQPVMDGWDADGVTDSGWSFAGAADIDEVEEQDGFYRVTYDAGHVATSVAILTAISKITGSDPAKLDVMFESVNPEAVDVLFATEDSSVSQLTFQYSGYEITVRTGGVIEVVAG